MVNNFNNFNNFNYHNYHSKATNYIIINYKVTIHPFLKVLIQLVLIASPSFLIIQPIQLIIIPSQIQPIRRLTKPLILNSIILVVYSFIFVYLKLILFILVSNHVNILVLDTLDIVIIEANRSIMMDKAIFFVSFPSNNCGL